jgi:hypothetical protein
MTEKLNELEAIIKALEKKVDENTKTIKRLQPIVDKICESDSEEMVELCPFNNFTKIVKKNTTSVALRCRLLPYKLTQLPNLQKLSWFRGNDFVADMVLPSVTYLLISTPNPVWRTCPNLEVLIITDQLALDGEFNGATMLDNLVQDLTNMEAFTKLKRITLFTYYNSVEYLCNLRGIIISYDMPELSKEYALCQQSTYMF